MPPPFLQKTINNTYASIGKKECDICHGAFKRGTGYTQHRAACQRREQAKNLRVLRDAIDAVRSWKPNRSTAALSVPSRVGVDNVEQNVLEVDNIRSMDWEDVAMDGVSDTEGTSAGDRGIACSNPEIAEDDNRAFGNVIPEAVIERRRSFDTGDDEEPYDRLVYHPSSDIPDRVVLPSRTEDQQLVQLLSPEAVLEPWRPFRSKADFEFAEHVVTCGLSKRAIDTELRGMRGAWADNCKLSFSSSRDVLAALDQAASVYMQFKQTHFDITYSDFAGRDRTETFTVWHRSLMGVFRELLTDPLLANAWIWFPFKKFRHSAQALVQVYDDFCTCEDWWSVQFEVPNGNVVLYIMVYTDKTRLTRFADVAAWPVIIRIGNLPPQIRNSQGYAGGIIVGWVPKVKAPREEGDNKRYVLLKREVYHRAMDIIFHDTIAAARFGETICCADSEVRTFHPLLRILSMDLEDQYYASLVRGAQCLSPCPKCFVPYDQLSELSVRYPSRTAQDTWATVRRALELRAQRGGIGQAEALLKSKGLYGLQSAFTLLPHTDVHDALAYDVLHFLVGTGLWGGHIWDKLQTYLKDMGLDTISLIHMRVDLSPRYPNWEHFSEIIDMTFADSNKHLAVLKRILTLIHDIVPERDRVILQLIRTVQCLVMYATLRMQTSERIQAGKRLVRTLEEQMKIATETLGWGWDYPKAHYLQHLFPDMPRKGPTGNYNTKLGESMHRISKDLYHQTNFKNTEQQMNRKLEHQLVIMRIRAEVDEAEKQLRTVSDEEKTDSRSQKNYDLGSPGPPILIQALERMHTGERPYVGLGIGLRRFLAEQGRELQVCAASSQEALLQNHDMVRPYKLIRMDFVSLDDSHLDLDLIRCNPSFFEGPRFDPVLVATDVGVRCARLHAVFSVRAYDRDWDVALVTFFTPVLSANESGIGQARVRESQEGRFILVANIIRHVILLPVDEDCEQFFVSDLDDGDMFLRLEQLYSQEDHV